MKINAGARGNILYLHYFWCFLCQYNRGYPRSLNKFSYLKINNLQWRLSSVLLISTVGESRELIEGIKTSFFCLLYILSSVYCTSSHLFSVHPLICLLYILSSIFCTSFHLFPLHTLFCSLYILSSVFSTYSHLFSVHPFICFLYILLSIFCTSSHLFSLHPLICFLYIF